MLARHFKGLAKGRTARCEEGEAQKRNEGAHKRSSDGTGFKASTSPAFLKLTVLDHPSHSGEWESRLIGARHLGNMSRGYVSFTEVDEFESGEKLLLEKNEEIPFRLSCFG